MLVRYKKSFEKIAMGLMSFMPEEKDIKKLRETINQYECSPNWQLFLWKKDEDYVGLIGVEQIGAKAVVQHLSVSPSHRGEGIGKQMVQKLAQMDLCETFDGSERTKAFIQKCMTIREEADDEN